MFLVTHNQRLIIDSANSSVNRHTKATKNSARSGKSPKILDNPIVNELRSQSSKSSSVAISERKYLILLQSYYSLSELVIVFFDKVKKWAQTLIGMFLALLIAIRYLSSRLVLNFHRTLSNLINQDKVLCKSGLEYPSIAWKEEISTQRDRSLVPTLNVEEPVVYSDAIEDLDRVTIRQSKSPRARLYTVGSLNLNTRTWPEKAMFNDNSDTFRPMLVNPDAHRADGSQSLLSEGPHRLTYRNGPSITRLWNYPSASGSRGNVSVGGLPLSENNNGQRIPSEPYCYSSNNGIAQSLADFEMASRPEARPQHPHGQDQRQRSHALQLEHAASKLVHYSRQQQQQQQQHSAALLRNQPMEYLAQGEVRIMGRSKSPDYVARSRDHIAQQSPRKLIDPWRQYCNQQARIKNNPLLTAMDANMGLFRKDSGPHQAQQHEQQSYQNDKGQSGGHKEEPMVLVSKSALSNLTDQIVSSMNRMKNLEDQVKVIPDLQRQLDNVISDSKNSSYNSAISGSSVVSDGQTFPHAHGFGNGITIFNNNNNMSKRPATSSSNSNSPLKSKELRLPAVGGHKTPFVNNDNDSMSNCNSVDRINQLQRQQSNEIVSGKELIQGSKKKDANCDQYYNASFGCPSTPRANEGLCLNKDRQPANSLDLSAMPAAAPSTGAAVTLPSGNPTRADKNCIHQYIADRLASNGHLTSQLRSSGNNKLQSPLRNLNADPLAQSMDPSACRNSNTVHLINDQDSQQQSQVRHQFNNSSSGISTDINNGKCTQLETDESAKTEYEELMNDLMSLSYSVNYTSTNNTNSLQSGDSNLRDNQIGTQQVSSVVVGSNNHNGNSNNVVEHHSVYNHSSPSQKSNHNQQNQQSNHNRRSNFTNSSSDWKLDCGCHSFKEHLRYNSISREQRLMSQNGLRGTQFMSPLSSRRSPQPSSTAPSTPIRHSSNHLAAQPIDKTDASTNTDLSMDSIVTRDELEALVARLQANNLSQQQQQQSSRDKFQAQIRGLAAMRMGSNYLNPYDASTSGDSGSNGSIPRSPHGMDSESALSKDQDPSPDSPSDSCEDERPALSVAGDTVDTKLKGAGEQEADNDGGDEYDDEDDEDDEDDDNDEPCDDDYENGETACLANSANEQDDVYSLGSSCQDPSDFEEYCAYGQSLDRRTKDFMSQSTKIPHDLRFALIRLNDFIKRQHSFDRIASSSGCIEVIRKEWFGVAASKESAAEQVKLYVDYFESFTKQLLNSVINLADQVGNRAIHYAASHFKLDIIDVLLQTKVCDVNCRNKAGYTPIMLLALTEITEPSEQEIARRLFSVGDVNIKAQASGQTALMLAASHGRLATCKLLLECGADPSLQDYDGSTALMCGSEIGHEQVVRCLLAHRLTDPNATDNDGLDALRIAMNEGHKSVGLILYAAKNVPRMATRLASNPPAGPTGYGSVGRGPLGGASFLGASLRKVRAKPAANFVKRADSLLGPRHSASRLMR